MRASSHSGLFSAAEMMLRPSPRPNTPKRSFAMMSPHGKNAVDFDLAQVGAGFGRNVAESDPHVSRDRAGREDIVSNAARVVGRTSIDRGGPTLRVVRQLDHEA